MCVCVCVCVCVCITNPHSPTRPSGSQTVFAGLQFLRMRTQEEDPHGDPNLKYPWLPEAGYKVNLIHYIAEAGAHARRHQRGTSDLKVCMCA